MADLWEQLSANPTTPEGQAGGRYLQQLHAGGQDWGEFLNVLRSIAESVARAREFHSIIPGELTLDDAFGAFQIQLYETWLQDYLEGELQEDDPRPWTWFVKDRFRDFLRQRQKTTIHRRQLLQTQSETQPTYQGTSRARNPLWMVPDIPPETLLHYIQFFAGLPAELRQVAQLLAEGWTQRDIAATLGVDDTTISRRRQRITALWRAMEKGGEDV